MTLTTPASHTGCLSPHQGLTEPLYTRISPGIGAAKPEAYFFFKDQHKYNNPDEMKQLPTLGRQSL